MRTLKVVLWIAAIGCLTAVPFMLLPWHTIDKFALWFGVEPIPNVPVIMYLFRITCGIFGLIGVYFIILAKNPLGYGPMLDLGGYGLIVFGLLSWIVGMSLNISPIMFAGDALSSLILGCAIIFLSAKAKRISTK